MTGDVMDGIGGGTIGRIVARAVLAGCFYAGLVGVGIGALPAQAVAATSSAVQIVEVQVAGATASDELIMLQNTSSQAVDLHGWQIRFRNSTAKITATTLLLTIAGPSTAPDGGQLLAPGQRLALHTATVIPPAGMTDQVYQAGLSATDKIVALYEPHPDSCQMLPTVAIGWGKAAAATQGVAVPVIQPGDQIFQRLPDEVGAALPTAGMVDCQVATAEPSDPSPPSAPTTPAEPSQPAGPSSLPAVPAPNEPVEPTAPLPTTPEIPPVTEQSAEPGPPATHQPPKSSAPGKNTTPVLPERDQGLYAPQLSEVFPNPGKPLVDAADEFVELYNPNPASYELTGFHLQLGTKKYAFPAGTLLSAHAFTAFYSRNTHLALTNTQGQVRLLDPFGRPVASADAYAKAPENQSWIATKDHWQWTTTRTPGAVNVLRAPASTTKAGAPSKTAQRSGSLRAPAAGKVQGVSTTMGATSTSAGGGTTDSSEAMVTTEQAAHHAVGPPLHILILAVTGVAAVSYGIYEYRDDLANKFYKFRGNRAARAAPGRPAEGRGDNRAGE